MVKFRTCAREGKKLELPHELGGAEARRSATQVFNKRRANPEKNNLLLQLVRGRPEARLPGRLNARPQKAKGWTEQINPVAELGPGRQNSGWQLQAINLGPKPYNGFFS